MSEIVVTEEMVEAARAAFHEVRLREASPHRTVREWETEAWRCALEAAWNRRAPSVTREEIAGVAERILAEDAGGCFHHLGAESSDDCINRECPCRRLTLEIADAILALLRDDP